MSKQLQRDIADLVEGYYLKGYNPYSVKKQPVDKRLENDLELLLNEINETFGHH